jgi:hypothetical protein
VDACAAANGTATGSDKTWTCECDPGYFIPETSSDGLCTSTFCIPGLPERCRSTVDNSTGLPLCLYVHFPYNCKCGKSQWFLDGSCIVNGVCGNNGFLTVSEFPPFGLSCKCDDGWTGDNCMTSICDSHNKREYFDVVVQNCACYTPYTHLSNVCKDNLCGVGQESSAPVVIVDASTKNLTTAIYQCNCQAPDYVLNGTGSTYPCVKNCFGDSSKHAAYALEDSCVCLKGYSGEFCQTQDSLVPSSSSSDPTVPVWGWVLVSLGIAGVLVTGLVIAARRGLIPLSKLGYRYTPVPTQTPPPLRSARFPATGARYAFVQ